MSKKNSGNQSNKSSTENKQESTAKAEDKNKPAAQAGDNSKDSNTDATSSENAKPETEKKGIVEKVKGAVTGKKDTKSAATGKGKEKAAPTAAEREAPKKAPAKPEKKVEKKVVTKESNAVEALKLKDSEGAICGYNRGVNVRLTIALDTLNSCSAKEMTKIVRARMDFYTNFFNGVASAETDEEAFQFVHNVLSAINKREFVGAKDRALLGFMRLSDLTPQQSNMYQLIWKALLDTANPATRSANAAGINWNTIMPLLGYHKRGDEVQKRLYSFYQRC